MSLICEIVQQALTTGWLAIAAETQLRQRLQYPYSPEERIAFMTLQEAVMLERVKQESRELLRR